MHNNHDFNGEEGMMINDNTNRRHKKACIIVDKVYDHCQQRICFEDVAVELPVGGDFEFVDILFNPGIIVPGSLHVTPIPDEPNFSRIRFKILITFTLNLHSREIIPRLLETLANRDFLILENKFLGIIIPRLKF